MPATAKLPMGRGLLLGYYALTLLFAGLDFLAGLNVRLAFLDGQPGLRVGYYVGLILCFLAMWRLPVWSRIIAVVESMIVLAALIVDFWLRIFAMPDTVLAGGDPIGFEEVANFALSGAAAYLALVLKTRRARGV